MQRLFTGDRPAVTIILVSTCHCGFGRVPLLGFHEDNDAEAIFDADEEASTITGQFGANGQLYFAPDGRRVLFIPVGKIDGGLEDRLITAGQQVAQVVQQHGLTGEIALAADPKYVDGDEGGCAWITALLTGYKLGSFGAGLFSDQVMPELQIYTDPDAVSGGLYEFGEQVEAMNAFRAAGLPSDGVTVVRIRLVRIGGPIVSTDYRDPLGGGSDGLLEALRQRIPGLERLFQRLRQAGARSPIET